MLVRELNPTKRWISLTVARRIAMMMQSTLQQSIVSLRDPPNAPSVVKRKEAKGHANPFWGVNPLIDTGFMLRAVAYRVNQREEQTKRLSSVLRRKLPLSSQRTLPDGQGSLPGPSA